MGKAKAALHPTSSGIWEIDVHCHSELVSESYKQTDPETSLG